MRENYSQLGREKFYFFFGELFSETKHVSNEVFLTIRLRPNCFLLSSSFTFRSARPNFFCNDSEHNKKQSVRVVKAFLDR